MTERPTTAFILSLIGGIITLILGLLSINSWFSLHSTVGGGFNYELFNFVNMTAGAAILLFVLGAICGISIIIGAVLQYSGEKSRVRVGSILVLVASIVGIPSTFFGLIIGGILSVVGAALGLTWKPKSSHTSDAQVQNVELGRFVRVGVRLIQSGLMRTLRLFRDVAVSRAFSASSILNV